MEKGCLGNGAGLGQLQLARCVESSQGFLLPQEMVHSPLHAQAGFMSSGSKPNNSVKMFKLRFIWQIW